VVYATILLSVKRNSITACHMRMTLRYKACTMTDFEYVCLIDVVLYNNSVFFTRASLSVAATNSWLYTGRGTFIDHSSHLMSFDLISSEVSRL